MKARKRARFAVEDAGTNGMLDQICSRRTTNECAKFVGSTSWLLGPTQNTVRGNVSTKLPMSDGQKGRIVDLNQSKPFGIGEEKRYPRKVREFVGFVENGLGGVFRFITWIMEIILQSLRDLYFSIPDVTTSCTTFRFVSPRTGIFPSVARHLILSRRSI
jgi:hypothetical protein